MSSRDLTLLSPDVMIAAVQWLARARSSGLEPLITCTYRSQAEQDSLYEQGRTRPGRIVTWTRKSRHSAVDSAGRPASTAWDFVPLIAGKAIWHAKHPHWLALGKLAESLNLEWGGRWRNPDKPHIQRRNA